MAKKVVFVSIGTSALGELYNKRRWDYEQSGHEWRGDKKGNKELVQYLFEENKNRQDKEYQHQKKFLIHMLKRQKKKFTTEGEINYDLLSAELASLKAMELSDNKTNIKSPGKFAPNDIIHLLYSDTPEGELCAEVCFESLKGFLNPMPVVESVQVKGLSMADPHRFVKEGVKNLKYEIEIRSNDSSAVYYFNITGGFKGAIPFFTILAAKSKMVNTIYLVYLFENAPHLLIAEPDDLISTPTVIYDLPK